MGVHDAIRAGNGVINFLEKNKDRLDVGKPKNNSFKQQEIFLNNLLLEFGKAHGIKMCKNNSPKYKGGFSPFMANSIDVQGNWGLFKKWLFENYEKKAESA